MDTVIAQREIEFRGYCDYKNQWEYGGFAKINNDVFIVAKCDFFKAIPESVGQYTGLKDKHGNKVFEGDIIQYMNDIENGKGTVEFHSSCFHVVWLEQNTSKPSIWTTMNYLQCSVEIEIIGNVFDNPELLNDR